MDKVIYLKRTEPREARWATAVVYALIVATFAALAVAVVMRVQPQACMEVSDGHP
jgi:hypothetical protein